LCIRWHVTGKQHFRSIFLRRQIRGPAQPLRAGVGERKWVNGGMVSVPPHFIRLSGAARCWPLCSPPVRMQTTDSHVAPCRDGGGRFFFSTGPHSSHKARGGGTWRYGGGRGIGGPPAGLPEDGGCQSPFVSPLLAPTIAHYSAAPADCLPAIVHTHAPLPPIDARTAITTIIDPARICIALLFPPRLRHPAPGCRLLCKRNKQIQKLVELLI
jgi:hypothetical protein